MEKEETHRLQGARIFFRMRQWLGHHQEMNRTGLMEKRRGGWSQREKRRCQRETEVPEIIIVSDAVESTKVDLDGKSHREQADAIILRREREVPGEEGQEIKSQNRKK